VSQEIDALLQQNRRGEFELTAAAIDAAVAPTCLPDYRQ
jgi:hypothetical protein